MGTGGHDRPAGRPLPLWLVWLALAGPGPLAAQTWAEWCAPGDAPPVLLEGGAAVLLTQTIALAGVDGGARVEGTVNLKPIPVPPRRGDAYAGSLAIQPGPPPPVQAVVYLAGSFPAEWLRPPPEPVAVYQRQLQFEPATVAVLAGTQVVFPNEDDTFHNVFSYSPTKRFDQGRFRKGELPPPILFDTPGSVRVFCEIHQHMRGLVLVLDSPFAAVTDAAGAFALDRLPVGDYEVVAWVSERRVYRQKVSLRPGAILRLNLGE